MSTESPKIPEGANGNRPHQGKFCISPFDFASVDVSGNVNLCCQGYLPLSAGNLNDAPFEAVWNSPLAREIRTSILDGSFRHCSKTCPYLQGDYSGKVFPRDAVPGDEYRRIIDEERTTLDRGPRELLAAYDATCNLSCPACRTEHIVARGAEFEQAAKIHRMVLNDGLKDVKLLYLSGQGDPFSSRIYREYMENFEPSRNPGLRIALITNALLLTPRMWNAISSSHPAISFLQISCNAASPEAFARVQRGGKWERFVDNVAFAGRLRAEGKIPFLRFSFYVSAWNYRDMKPFIAFAEAHGADDVVFSLMDGSFIMSDDEFKEVAVHLPGHPEHGAFLAALDDPAFAGPHVSVGNLRPFFPEDFFDGAAAEMAGGPSIELQESTVEALARALEADEEQAVELEAWVLEVKRLFASVMSAPAADGGPAPVAVLAQALEGGGADGETVFEERAKTALHQASGRYYFDAFQVGYFHSLGALAWLSPRQTGALRSVDVGSLLEIRTSVEPFHDAVAASVRGGSVVAESAHEPSPLTEQVADLGLRDDELAVVDRMIAEARRAFAALAERPPQSGGPQPVDFLAERLAAKAPGAQQLFLQYLAKEKPEDAFQTYLEMLQSGEKLIGTLLEEQLGAERWGALRSAIAGPLFNWPSRHDPFGDLLKERVAALGARQKATAP